MAVIEITAENFKTEVVESDKPVLIDFWAVWCGPCSMMSPVVDQVAEEHPEIKVGKVNTDEQPMLAQQFAIRAIPTLVLMNEGKPVASSQGAVPIEQVEKLLERL